MLTLREEALIRTAAREAVARVKRGEWLTVSEAAEVARCSQRTLWKWMGNGLAYLQHASGGPRLIRVSELDRYLLSFEAAV